MEENNAVVVGDIYWLRFSWESYISAPSAEIQFETECYEHEA